MAEVATSLGQLRERNESSPDSATSEQIDAVNVRLDQLYNQLGELRTRPPDPPKDRDSDPFGLYALFFGEE